MNQTKIKITEIKGDAVKLNRETPDAVLIHVCNDKGVMGSGIALQIKNEHPAAYSVYREYYEAGHGTGGRTTHADRIINMVAQSSFGAVGSARFLNYGWLARCLCYANAIAMFYNAKRVIVPVKMGAFRAGGDWEIVKEMVIGVFESGSVTEIEEIIFCEFDKG